MFKKDVSGTMLFLLLIGIFSLTVNIEPVKSTWTGTVYIRADGSIDPLDAPVITYDNITYILTDNITSYENGIVVERDNIVIDGAGYTLEGPGGTGIDLSGRTNVTIRNTQIKNFSHGIYLSQSSNNTIIGNNITANNVYGVVLVYSSNYNRIIGNNITNNGFGVGLFSSSNYNSVSGNNITNNSEGVVLGSSSNSVSGNNITNNSYNGVYLLFSSLNNSIIGNNITANNYRGVWLGDSSNNSIIGNTFTNDGLAVGDSYHNVVEDNTVNGKPLVYLEDVADYSVGDAGEVILVNCTGIRVENLNLSRTDMGVQLRKTNSSVISGNNIATNNIYGILLEYSFDNSIIGNNIATNNLCGVVLLYSSNNIISGNNITPNNNCGVELDYSSNNTISGNNITNNNYGVALGLSSNNRVIGNNITNNGYGVWPHYSSNNLFYHNNFIDNGVQVYSTGGSINVWDCGYPVGGNYWSDYTGVDYYSGPYQNETGSDGIGDIPYIVDTDNVDRYPLMNPWQFSDIAVTNITISKTIVGQGYTMNINVAVQNQGNYAETFNVTVYANATAIETKEITLQSGATTTLTFTWNTSGFAKGNYTIWAYAWPVPGETDTSDNTLIDGNVYMGIPGDVNGDGIVEMMDFYVLCVHFGHTPPDEHLSGTPHYTECFNADINSDGIIELMDFFAASQHFGKTDP